MQPPDEYDRLVVTPLWNVAWENAQYMRTVFRADDKEEALECLKKQGGLDTCSLSFYSDKDIGKDGVWDNWRLEGPSFVWYFRGEPHVHVWVNIADDASVKLNAKG